MSQYANTSSGDHSRTPTPSSIMRQDFADFLDSNFVNNEESESQSRSQPRVNGETEQKRNGTAEYIMKIQEENQSLRRELDIKEKTLVNNMNSIKTFWSPELKKERTIRIGECDKSAKLRDQLKRSQDENQNYQLTVQALQDEIRAQRDLNQILQEDLSGSGHLRDPPAALDRYADDPRIVQDEMDRLSRENELLQRTMEEMEMRIESQKQTLEARDESVSKLMELLQSKTFPGKETDSEVDSLKMQLVEAEARLVQLDSMLMERNFEIHEMKNALPDAGFSADLPKIQSLQAVINMKDGKLAILEHDLNLLEEENMMLKRGGRNTNGEREEESKQLEVLKSHSNFMKNKIEQLKCDLQKKDTMLATMQTKLDTLNNQQSDSRQHIDVLKESLAAKEQRTTVLQAEVDSLRTRLDEKQQVLDRKQEQLSVLQEERSANGGELAHLQDTLEVKSRKIVILHKKIESLAEAVREKDRQLEIIRQRMQDIQKDSHSSETALSTMEEALTQKEKFIKKLQAQLKTGEEKWKSDLGRYEQEQKNLIVSCNSMKQELSEKETSLSDMKEHASALASAGLKKDSQIKQMDISMQQLKEKLSHNETQLHKAQAELEGNQRRLENEKKLADVEKLAKDKEEEVAKCQTDLDRLLKILTETENEKHEKDMRLVALERQVKDQQAKIKSLQNKMVEDSKLKGAAHSKDTNQFLTQIRARDERIEELEEALRQSVLDTADRESVLTQERENARQLRTRQEEIEKQVELSRNELDDARSKFKSAEAALYDREKTIHALQAERRKRVEELFDIKQEALLAAISEKDANIALLELSGSKKRANQEEVQSLKKEKNHLVSQLKQQTENRLQLMQGTYFEGQSQSRQPASPHQKRHSHSSPGSSRRSQNGHHSSKKDEEGIWA